jgi:putative transposase
MAKEEVRCRTFRYRLHPTKLQIQALNLQRNYQCELYNAALQERIGAWKWERRSVSYFDQCRTLTGLRECRPEVVASSIALCRGTLKRLDRAYGAFFRRVELGEEPGFPRFRSENRFDALQWEDTPGWTLKTQHRRLYIMGIGEIKANYHRPFAGQPKAITVKREGIKWWLSVRCVNVPALPLERTCCQIGIDLGVVNLIATSDGELIKGKHFGGKAQKHLSQAQRELSAKQRGSKRRQLQVNEVVRLHAKIKNQRRNAAHQLSRHLVNDYDLIAFEDLKIRNMVRAPRARPDPNQLGAYLPNGASTKAGLNVSINDAGWGLLLRLLTYKAESAGRSVVRVNPCHTSQTCAECRHVDARNRVNQEKFRCLSCGHRDFADINAARNILGAGRALQASACPGRI